MTDDRLVGRGSRTAGNVSQGVWCAVIHRLIGGSDRRAVVRRFATPIDTYEETSVLSGPISGKFRRVWAWRVEGSARQRGVQPDPGLQLVELPCETFPAVRGASPHQIGGHLAPDVSSFPERSQ